MFLRQNSFNFIRNNANKFIPSCIMPLSLSPVNTSLSFNSLKYHTNVNDNVNDNKNVMFSIDKDEKFDILKLELDNKNYEDEFKKYKYIEINGIKYSKNNETINTNIHNPNIFKNISIDTLQKTFDGFIKLFGIGIGIAVAGPIIFMIGYVACFMFDTLIKPFWLYLFETIGNIF